MIEEKQNGILRSNVDFLMPVESGGSVVEEVGEKKLDRKKVELREERSGVGLEVEIEEARAQINLAAKPESVVEDSRSWSAISADNLVSLQINQKEIERFFLEFDLKQEDIDKFSVEFTQLKQSNKFTRFLARFLPPGRLQEIFTRIESLSGDNLKIFTNNVTSMYSDNDQELLVQDTLHHLVHYVQKKQGRFGFVQRFLSRLPIIHGISRNEREARTIAKDRAKDFMPMINYDNKAGTEEGTEALKIKV